MQGSQLWVKPQLLDDTMQENKQKAINAKKPASEQERVLLHANIRVLGLPQVEHVGTCEGIMAKVAEATKLPLTKTTNVIPGTNEWAICFKANGEFAQRISIQVESEAALRSLIAHVHGSGIRINGHDLVVEVRSLSSYFCLAGQDAKNVIAPPQSLTDQFAGGGQRL